MPRLFVTGLGEWLCGGVACACLSVLALPSVPATMALTAAMPPLTRVQHNETSFGYTVMKARSDTCLLFSTSSMNLHDFVMMFVC